MSIRQNSDRAVINWQSFNIGKDASVSIIQPDANSVLLNRVTGESPSQIFGQLHANGQVVLVNPNGVTLGKDGSVSAAGFTASTLGISDAEFMASKMRYTREGAKGSVVNQGQIATQGGYVALLGASVSNEGRIETRSGAVLLGAAETVKLPLSSSGRIKLEFTPVQLNASVANTRDGVIVTKGGQVYMQAAAVNQALANVLQSGSMDTSAIQGGDVQVLADGGQIRVDGRITANSHDAANQGGDIVIGRDLTTGVLAHSTDVSGAQLESRGGFVETSGHHLETAGARVQAGQWLLDPDNIDITGDDTAPIANHSKIKASDIAAALDLGTSVTVHTTDGVSPASVPYTPGWGDGNIVISAPITTNVVDGSTATLTLVANNGFTIASTGGITDASGGGVLNVDITARGRVGILFNGSRGITLSGPIDIEGSAKLYAQNSSSSGPVVDGRTAIVINSVAGKPVIKAGSVEMVGISDGLYDANAGMYGSGYGILAWGSIEASGNVDMTGWSRNNGDALRLAGGIKSDSGNIEVLGLIQSTPAAVHIDGKLSALNGSVTVTGGSSLKSPGSLFTTISKDEVLAGSSRNWGATQGIYANNATIEGANVTLKTPQNTLAGPNIGLQTQGTTKVTATSTLNINVEHTTQAYAGTRIYGASSLSAPTVNIQTDTLHIASTASTPVGASGAVTIAPKTAGQAVQLGVNDKITWPWVLALDQAELNQIATPSLTIGNASTGNLTVAGAVSTLNATGDLTLSTGGNLAINAALQTGTTGTKNLTLNLTGSGSATQTAALKTHNLELLGSNASYTLNNVANDASTLAAVVKTLGYTDANALTVGAIGNTSGIVASGTVSVATRSGDLTLTQAISTTDSGTSAIVLNAGQASDAGTASGGDLQLSGLYSLSTGSGGRTTLYTGNLANANLTSLVGSGTGRFRYNSDESSTGYSAALGSGLHAIYRAGPTYDIAIHNETRTYNGEPYSGGNGYTVTQNNLVNGDASVGLSGTLVYGGTSQGARNAGSYSLNGSGLSSSLGYVAVTTPGTLTIGKASASVSGTYTTVTYNGATQTQTAPSTSGFIDGDAITVTGAASGKNAGTYTSALQVGGADAGNYEIAVTNADLVIDKVSATITANSASVTYNGSTQSVSGFTATGLVGGETSAVLTGVSTSGGSGRNAGTYAHSASGTDANYELNFVDGALTIDKAPLTLSGNSLATTYNGQTQSVAGVTASGLQGTDTVADLVNVQASGAAGRNAGSYTNTVTAGEQLNYTVSTQAGTLRIDQAPLQIAAVRDTKVYDGTINSTAAVQVNGLQGSDTVVASQQFTLKDVQGEDGSTLQVVSHLVEDGNSGGNYTVSTSSASGTITPAPLTVTANDDYRFVTQSDNTAYRGVRYSGFVAGEDASVLGGSVTVNRDRQAQDQAAGLYAGVLVPSGLTASNYSMVYMAGNYRIVPADQLVIDTPDVSSVYGQAGSYSPTARYLDSSDNLIKTLSSSREAGTTRFEDGAGGAVTVRIAPYADSSVSAGSTPAGLSSAGQLPVGQYALGDAAPQVEGGNFVGAPYFYGQHTVTPAALSPAVMAPQKVYDGTTSMTDLQLGLNGKLAADTVQVLGVGEFSQRHAGTGLAYSVSSLTLTGVDAANYYLTGAGSYSGQDGVITPAPLQLTSTDVVKTYDASTQASGSALATGGTRLFADDRLEGGSFAFASADAGLGNRTVKVDGVVVQDGNEGRNYNVSYVDNTTSTIYKAQATVTANSASVTYNGSTQSVSGFTATGLVGGETTAVLAGVSTSGGSGRNAGTYAHTASGTDPNYELSFVDGALTVGKASASVRGTYTSVTYNGATQTQSPPITNGFMASDDIAIRGVASGQAVGSYWSRLKVTGVDAVNYDISITNAALTIAAQTSPSPAAQQASRPLFKPRNDRPIQTLSRLTWQGFGAPSGAAVAGIEHTARLMPTAMCTPETGDSCVCETLKEPQVELCTRAP